MPEDWKKYVRDAVAHLIHAENHLAERYPELAAKIREFRKREVEACIW